MSFLHWRRLKSIDVKFDHWRQCCYSNVTSNWVGGHFFFNFFAGNFSWRQRRYGYQYTLVHTGTHNFGCRPHQTRPKTAILYRIEVKFGIFLRANTWLQRRYMSANQTIHGSFLCHCIPSEVAIFGSRNSHRPFRKRRLSVLNREVEFFIES